MKKIILLLTFTILLFSCSNNDDNSSSSNTNGNTTNGNVNYYFKININGVEHKVQGNTSSFGGGNNQNIYISNPNECRAMIGTTTGLLFKIADITNPNYVSGQNLFMIVNIPNCRVGLNQATLTFLTSYALDDFMSSLGKNSIGFVENSGLYCYGAYNCEGSEYTSYSNKITINITDMGTPTGANTINPSQNLFNYGKTFKGSYSGPVYFAKEFNNRDSFIMNIPMQFSMEFEAYRIN